jgi:RNA polymerase sigma factor (sigma-70 family)
MGRLTEKNLWKNFKNGDDSALTRIYTEYADQLYAYGLKIINHEALVKDCIQEVFIQLIEKRETLVITSKIQIYLFKSLRNKLFEELRSEKRKKDILNLLTDSHPMQGNTVEQEIMVSEDATAVKEKLNQALAKLTDHQRELIHLKYTLDFSNTEIAELLQIDVASARTLLYRALKKVRKSLTL